jgi:uncharacterized membrane protein YkoI
MMTRNHSFAAIMAYLIAIGAAGSMAMSPALAGPAEEAAQDFEGWRAAQKAAAQQAQQTETRGMATRAQSGRDVARISLPQARAIALATSYGQITDEELEHERGGSGLRYSFDIKNGRVTHEVGVDAKTGRVLENSVESAR